MSSRSALNSLAQTTGLSLEKIDPAPPIFSWDAVRHELDGLPRDRGLNIAHEAIDRHARANGEAIALRWLGLEGRSASITYRELQLQSSRFANVLETLGLQRSAAVFTLTPRLPLLIAVVMGTLKHLNVFCPLFESFGPEPLHQRLSQGKAALLVTTERHWQRKIADWQQTLPHLQHVLLIDTEIHLAEDVLSLPLLMRAAETDWEIPVTPPETPALLHFTSGTTAMPKGALHVHEAAVSHYASSRYTFNLQRGDVFWCTADPGWVTGTSYTIIAPLLHGITTLIDQADFDAGRWLNILDEEKVNVLYTSPSAIRRLMRMDESLFADRAFPHLRTIHSVGEPLDPAAVSWGERLLGRPIHDTWWQTETGGIMIANLPDATIVPGSMGKPLPGISAGIIDPKTGKDLQAGIIGMLALQTGWPSMFRGYLHDEQRYRDCFVGNWYLSGDMARMDDDGRFWFCGRADDIIKTAGHMVGPFEVEAVLNSHPAVVESAVFGSPDPLLGEKVTAAVVVKMTVSPTESLRQELIGLARRRLGPAIAPRHLEFLQKLPRNRAGKIMRRLLKTSESGQAMGDISTLDTKDDADAAPPQPKDHKGETA